MWLIMLTLWLLNDTNSEAEENGVPIYFEKMGVLLQTEGIVAMASYFVHISAMIKMEKPKIIQYDEGCNRQCTKIRNPKVRHHLR